VIFEAASSEQIDHETCRECGGLDQDQALLGTLCWTKEEDSESAGESKYCDQGPSVVDGFDHCLSLNRCADEGKCCWCHRSARRVRKKLVHWQTDNSCSFHISTCKGLSQPRTNHGAACV
jgi:hypothetical protein